MFRWTSHSWVRGSTISALLHDKINPKDCQVKKPLVIQGFSKFFRVLSSDYGKPRIVQGTFSIFWPSTPENNQKLNSGHQSPCFHKQIMGEVPDLWGEVPNPFFFGCFYKVGPLQVISGVIISISRVITPVTQL